MSDLDRERRKNNMKNYYCKRKNLNPLINCVIEELENTSISK